MPADVPDDMDVTRDPHPAGRRAELDALLAAPHRLRVHFQPIVDLRRAVVCGYEALARPEGDVPVAECFAAAAREGRSAALEAQALEAALVQRPLLAGSRTIGVNLSAQAFLSPEVEAVLGEHVWLDGLVVEITAQGPPADPEAIAHRAEVLRGRGAVMAADDADQLPEELLEAIVPSFVKVHVGALDAGREIAARLTAMLVVKGVEGDEELYALASAGVRLVQGFALGVPVPVPGELDRAVAAGLRGLAVGRDARLSRPARPVLGDLVGPREPADALAAGLRLAAATPLAAAATAAMDRPPATRFDPVVVVAGDGEIAGVVPVERLVRALAG